MRKLMSQPHQPSQAKEHGECRHWQPPAHWLWVGFRLCVNICYDTLSFVCDVHVS